MVPEGNRRAIDLMARVFSLRDSFEWRGLGPVPKSALKLSPEFAEFDAETRFGLVEHHVPDNKACQCGAILRGEKEPFECKAFGKALHAGSSARLLHGFERRRLRSLLQLRPAS